MEINIFSDFTDTPGARYRSDGDFSGQEFLEDILEPKFLECFEKNELLTINLDKTWGYASSFISGSFGELAKKYKNEDILRIIKFISNDDPNLIDEIIKIIKFPESK